MVRRVMTAAALSDADAPPHDPRAERAVLLFSSSGHALMHFMAAFFPFIAVGLAAAWGEPDKPLDHQVLLLPLWTLGAFLIGLGAMPAGWLGDRIGAPAMMVVMFVGMGFSSVLCGLAPDRNTLLLQLGLAGLGFFASIYHAVGIAWVMRNAARPGHALGVNGVFGSIGLAAAGAVTGLLISLFSWRAAFVVPGVASILMGVWLFASWRAGRVGDRPMPKSATERPSRGDMVRVFLVLTFTMFVGGVIWQAIQYGAPGLFESRLQAEIDWLQSATNGQFAAEAKKMAFWVGLFGSSVYVASGLFQYLTGGISDRYSLKTVYVVTSFLQILAMLAIAWSPGYGVVLGAMASAMISAASGPAENLLIGRYTPSRHHGLGFGAKFVVAFGAGPVAIWLIALVKREFGDLELLFLGLAVAGAVVWLAALFLPGGRDPGAVRAVEPRVAPAE